ncbi:unnamed protein product [Polarella glacialis]|uniref:Uncharacterized protein n=1 Tax=Polarella glacialis TaxID=89957 RepID=A0A813E2D2_POLGL|nr:unnamed protein product [Polarella glacialis]
MAATGGRVLAGLALVATAAGNKCPGSSAFVHASCQVTVTAQASCSDVMAEMEARVAGIAGATWHDPHNRGTYSLLSKGDGELNFQRVTGNKLFTDKQTFTFVDSAQGICEVSGCSESQGTSFADFSTNYCDLRMLYCGSSEGCKPVLKDFAIKEHAVSPSLGASDDPKACLVSQAVSSEFLMVSRRLQEEASSLPTCPPAGFSTVTGFDLDSFIQSRWYIQQQMPLPYLPATQNRCVYADYRKAPKGHTWGYELDVHNHAEENAAPHVVHDSGSLICAKIVDAATGKLKVAPCFLPGFLAGPYWVIAWSEEQGYALISGGAPTHSAPGGCRTGTGTNNAGLWIFTRKMARDEALVKKVSAIAVSKGFDVSVLLDVDQTGCGAEVTEVTV